MSSTNCGAVSLMNCVTFSPYLPIDVTPATANGNNIVILKTIFLLCIKNNGKIGYSVLDELI